MIKEYLRDYGARVPNELKLESETLSERPELLTRLLQSLVQTESGITEHTDRSASSPEEFRYLSPWKRSVLKWLLSWAGCSIGLREETRFRRALIFGYARRVFLALGRRLQALGALDKPEDVFFLTEDELFLHRRRPFRLRGHPPYRDTPQVRDGAVETPRPAPAHRDRRAPR